MKDYFFRRIANSMVPADPATYARLHRYRRNALVRVHFPRTRSPESMRFYRSLCGLVADNHRMLLTPGLVHQRIKLETGHVTLVQSVRTGDIYKVPNSVSFDAMDADAWDDWLPLALDFIVHELLAGVRKQHVHDQILSMLGERPPERRRARQGI